jgi:hypothetical protein
MTIKQFDFDDDDEAWQEIPFNLILNSPLLPPFDQQKSSRPKPSVRPDSTHDHHYYIEQELLVFENHQQVFKIQPILGTGYS